MLKTIDLENSANLDAFHTLSVGELDLVSGSFDWKSGLAGGAVGFAAGVLFVGAMLAL